MQEQTAHAHTPSLSLLPPSLSTRLRAPSCSSPPELLFSGVAWHPLPPAQCSYPVRDLPEPPPSQPSRAYWKLPECSP